MKILSDFKLESVVSEETLNKYQEVIPEELITVWKDYGFGSFMNGYLRTINPDEYHTFIENGYMIENLESAIPIFSTGFGDIIVWQDNKYLNLLSYKTEESTIISSGFSFFLEDLTNKNFVQDFFEYDLYLEAVSEHGLSGYSECFGYVPLLPLGGKKSVKNLEIGKLKEHILVILALVGPIVID